MSVCLWSLPNSPGNRHLGGLDGVNQVCLRLIEANYFGLSVDMARSGMDVEMAVAAPGRACGDVLEELERQEGKE